MNEAAGMEQIAANAERKTLPSEEQERTIESVSRLLYAFERSPLDG